jgi:chemotaxis protein CheC
MIANDDFEDAMAELVNVGVGRAAAALSSMVCERIELSVPRLMTIRQGELLQHLDLEDCPEVDNRLSLVQQAFDGCLGGKATVLFPLESARKLVGLLTDGVLSAEELDLEREAALTEVGNILINGVMGTIGNITGVEIRYRLPEYAECPADRIEDTCSDRELLLAVVLIAISGMEIKGHLLLLFDLASMENLTGIIQSMSQIPD